MPQRDIGEILEEPPAVINQVGPFRRSEARGWRQGIEAPEASVPFAEHGLDNLGSASLFLLVSRYVPEPERTGLRSSNRYIAIDGQMVLTRQSGRRPGDEAVLSVRAAIEERRVAGLLSLLLVALIPPLELGVMAVPMVAGLGLATLAIRYRDQHSLIFVIVFASAFLVLGALLKELFTWPWHLLIPLMIAATAARIWKSEARLALGWRSGDVSAQFWLAAFAISVITTIALVAWVELFQPDLEAFRAMVPRGDLLVLISAALGFALLNATMEELIWRGGIQSWLVRHTSIGLTILIQALSFGALHWAGFPSGWSGVALATLYGVMLGWLRNATGGLAAPIVAHILADLTIFLLVLGSS